MSGRLSSFAAAAALLLALLASAAIAQQAERRVALVIGNDAYQNVTSLKKAVNDARAVAKTLGAIGFEVIERENADRRTMNLALTEFTNKIAGGGVGLLYYAGHGVQIAGSNYLIPVDVPALSNPDDLRDETIDIGRVLERLSQAKAKLNIVILDACRDNPFPKVAGRSLGGTRGLTIPESPNGILIVYSAGVNQSAIDSLGPDDKSPNGLFTRKLLPLMQEPGLRLDEAVRRMRRDVSQTAKAVGGEQNPAIYDQTDGDFYFVLPAPAQQAAAPAPAPAAPPKAGAGDETMEVAFWNSVKDEKNADAFREYLRQFPKGKFAGLARLKMKELTEAPTTREAQPQVAMAAPPPAPAPKKDGPAEEAFQRGFNALHKLAYAEAMKWSRVAADRGSANAAFSVGLMYDSGWGVARDHAEAIRWYRKAAEQGDGRARVRVGHMYRTGDSVPQDAMEAERWFGSALEALKNEQAAFGVPLTLAALYERGYGVPKDRAEAVRWAGIAAAQYRQAADRGDAIAQFDLANLYESGFGVAKDYAEAMRWLRKAADQGMPQAQNSVGWLHENGWGVRKDYAEALRWYRKAADQGFTYAQNNVGRLYYNGWDVPKDYAEAMQWYRKAADQGNAQAQANVAWLYKNGWGVPQDNAEAMQWYRKAADQGFAQAQNNVGWFYENGWSVPQDHAEAMQWYRKAANQGYAQSQSNVGSYYRNGWSVPRDYAEAMRWYRKAADQGFAQAQANIGSFYAKGQGVPQDDAQARSWFKQAAAQGNEDAKKWLAEHGGN